MIGLLPILIVLACPLGMVTMITLPTLRRVFGRRAKSTAAGVE